MPKQAEPEPVASDVIVGSHAFRRGVAEVRTGRSPRFDDEVLAQDGMQWAYEWGRQFALLAPPDLPLISPDEGTLNPKAVYLFNIYLQRGQLCR
ncbi:hypothetical protein HNR60_002922 [Rhodopseudomonas rhenobacensis]|uniref:Uncharacterized protein n=1 Tax=Rhodopseudomonas rhenobacensis TaxID=87461 RepID=A0A7W7Z527_9BRAD|nr:hypothetical protein [Rhodopseudomonas rhenobacensis]MBB5048160.1 hypothetical protein [Rhodopseudomonas rhenobacensis]